MELAGVGVEVVASVEVCLAAAAFSTEEAAVVVGTAAAVSVVVEEAGVVEVLADFAVAAVSVVFAGDDSAVTAG